MKLWNGSEPDSPTERVGVLVAELYNGEEMTTREAAELLGMSRWGALALLYRLERVLAIERVDGRWRKMPQREPQSERGVT